MVATFPERYQEEFNARDGRIFSEISGRDQFTWWQRFLEDIKKGARGGHVYSKISRKDQCTWWSRILLTAIKEEQISLDVSIICQTHAYLIVCHFGMFLSFSDILINVSLTNIKVSFLQTYRFP